jgi:hypothetical protein
MLMLRLQYPLGLGLGGSDWSPLGLFQPTTWATPVMAVDAGNMQEERPEQTTVAAVPQEIVSLTHGGQT